MESLKNQIDQFREKFRTIASPEKIKTIENGIASQNLNRGLGGIAKVGDFVADFNFININGKPTIGHSSHNPEQVSHSYRTELS